MAVAVWRHDRLLAIQQAQLVWALFGESKLDLMEFVNRGELKDAAVLPMPHIPGVDEAIAAIHANGGKLIIPESK